MDIHMASIVAGSVISILASYVKKVAGKTLDQTASNVGNEITQAAISSVKKLFDIVKEKFSSNSNTKMSFAKFEQDPDSQVTRDSIEAQVRDFLSDEVFSRKVLHYLELSANNHADAVFNTNISGNVEKVVNVGNVSGDLNIN